MAQGDPSSWEPLGPNDPTRYRATFVYNRSQGSGQVPQNVRVITNRDDGNYDVYTTAPGVSDQRIFSYNASNNQTNVINPGIYNQIFTGSGRQQLTNLNAGVRRATLQLAENNVSGGPNSISSTNLQRLRSSPGYQSLANTSSAPPAPILPAPEATPAAGATPPPPVVDGLTSASPEEQARITELRRPSTRDYGDIQYPSKNRYDSTADYIKIQLLEYKKSGLASADGKLNIARMDDRINSIKGTVYLPIQSGIVDNCSVDWGQGDLNPLTAKFANLAYGTIAAAEGGLSPALNQMGSGIAEIMRTMNNATPELRQMLVNYFTQEAVGVPGLLSRTVGGAINNNIELLFNGPTLRSFTFTFRLTPREKKESADIKKIIRMFKTEMHPALSESELFLLAPNVFKLTYMSGSSPHPYLNKIKVCALKDFSVNYTPDGSYMTYSEDKSMTAYELTMSFAEISPIYKQDYEEGQGLEGMGW